MLIYVFFVVAKYDTYTNISTEYEHECTHEHRYLCMDKYKRSMNEGNNRQPDYY